MPSVEQIYNHQLKYYTALRDNVSGTISLFCNNNNFLFSGRVKSCDSLRDKLETGRFKSFSDIDDIVAFSIIVDTSDQTRNVAEFIKGTFEVVESRTGGTIRDERVFDFDCARYYCQISDPDGVRKPLSEIVFEIQVRTILQHAWSKVTHRHVYKPERFDYRSSRLASETMAHIESIDRTFTNFSEIAKNVKRVTRKGMAKRLEVVRVIDKLIDDGIVPKEIRPQNGRRFGDNVYEAIVDPDKNFDAAMAVIKQFLSSESGRMPRSVTLFQLITVALYKEHLLSFESNGRDRYYHITPELVGLFPDVAKIENRVDGAVD